MTLFRQQIQLSRWEILSSYSLPGSCFRLRAASEWKGRKGSRGLEGGWARRLGRLGRLETPKTYCSWLVMSASDLSSALSMIFLALTNWSWEGAAPNQLLPIIILRWQVSGQYKRAHQDSRARRAASQSLTYNYRRCSSLKGSKPMVLLSLCLKWPKVVVFPPRRSARVPSTHSRGLTMKGPFFIPIILVVTPKGRTDSTSILSRFSSSRILEQTSTLLLPALQTPSREERYTPVQEEMLRMAPRWVRARSWGMRMRLRVKTAVRSTCRSLSSASALLLTQCPPVTEPALLITIPMSSPANLRHCSSSWASCPRSARSETRCYIFISLQVDLSSATLPSTRFWLRPMSSRLNPYSAKTCAKPIPIPSLNPVMATQQSPYRALRLLALSFVALRTWEGSQLQRDAVRCSNVPAFSVRAPTPSRKSSFSSTASSFEKSSNRRQSATSATTPTLATTLLSRKGTGLQSSSTCFNISQRYNISCNTLAHLQVDCLLPIQPSRQRVPLGREQ